MKAFKSLALTTALACASLGALAQAPTTIGCPWGSIPAKVDVDLVLNTTLTSSCPLLQESTPRKLVDKFAAGTSFAYPMVNGTCMSGSGLTGTITPTGSSPIAVTGQTWSAQTLFPEAASVGNGLAITGTAPDGGPFLSGAAITVASIRSASGLLRLDLVLSDRFTIDLATGVDAEDLQIIGSGGLLGATGKLTGLAMIAGQPIVNAPMEITGTICLK